ncbi:carboxypeptidase regulatory-like domain-containing protein [Acidobacteria bacterium AH-259-D05]|nr:carboxypeptidase regulatory-like domain-containing protein [Acidobacteria bacterium AH-259-D05]
MKKTYLFATVLFLLWPNMSVYSAGMAEGGTIEGSAVTRALRSFEDVVIYLEEVPGDFKPPAKNPVMDQKNLIFTPHIMPIVAGTTVDFPNSDEVRHNVFSPSKTKKFNLGTYPAGVVRQVLFEKPGVVALLCNVHQEMSAYVVVLTNPYFARTGRRGKFVIENVPPGTYTIKTWHEKLKPAKETVQVSPGATVRVDFNLRR